MDDWPGVPRVVRLGNNPQSSVESFSGNKKNRHIPYTGGACNQVRMTASKHKLQVIVRAMHENQWMQWERIITWAGWSGRASWGMRSSPKGSGGWAFQALTQRWEGIWGVKEAHEDQCGWGMDGEAENSTSWSCTSQKGVKSYRAL